MHRIRAVLILCVLVTASSAHAQQLRVGGDVGLLPTLSSWSDVSGVGVGGLVKAEYLVLQSLALTGRIGYLFHFEKSHEVSAFGATFSASSSTTELPVMVGVKYFIGGEPEGGYAAAELGLVHFSGSGGTGTYGSSQSDLETGLTLGGGYEVNGLDLRLQLFFPALDHDDYFGLMLSVGYAVSLLL